MFKLVVQPIYRLCRYLAFFFIICFSQYFFSMSEEGCLFWWRAGLLFWQCWTWKRTELALFIHIGRPILQILFSIGVWKSTIISTRSHSLIVWLPEESEKTLSKHWSAHLSVLTHQLQTQPMMLVLGGTLFFWPMECLGNLLGNRSFISSLCFSRHFQSRILKDAIFEGDKYRQQQWHATTQYQ